MAHTGSTESDRHESSHLRLRAVVKFTIWFVIGAAAIHLIIWQVFVIFRTAEAKEERQASGVAEAQIPPPEPRLQPSMDHNKLPAMDLAEMHARERVEFARRGWIDEKTGAIHVPEGIAQQVARLSQPRKL